MGMSWIESEKAALSNASWTRMSSTREGEGALASMTMDELSE